MSLAALDERTGVLGRRNALAKLVAATVVGVPLLLSIDPVSAAVALAAVLVLLPFARLSARGLWLRLWPIVVSALIAAAATVLYGRAGGDSCTSPTGRCCWRPPSHCACSRSRCRVSCCSRPPTPPISPTRSPSSRSFRPGSSSARSRACGSWACSSTTGTSSPVHVAREGSPTTGGCAASSVRRSRCSCWRSGGVPISRRRWRRAASTRPSPARGRARRG